MNAFDAHQKRLDEMEKEHEEMKQNARPPKPLREFMTRKGYRALVSKANEFIEALMGDAGFERVTSNRIALEAMLVGWLRGTPRWKQYDADCVRLKLKDNLYLLAQDQAAQAAQDAIFSERNADYLTFFCSIGELNEMISELPAREKMRFAAKVKPAMDRLNPDGTPINQTRFAGKVTEAMKRLQISIAEGKQKLGYKSRMAAKFGIRRR